MSKTNTYFKKEGGINLIKRYWQNGVLGTAIAQFLLLGSSRTALELLRLSVNFRIYRALKKKYSKYLNDFSEEENLNHIQSNRVWVCWFQGIDNNTPLIVRRCVQSMYDNLKNEEIILLTNDNYSDYVSLPDFIIKKYDEGIITKTHLTDLLRLEILIKYGGIWIDATVLCTGEIPDYIIESDLFLFQNLKPGRDGDAIALSSWFIAAKTNNKVLMATQKLMYEYWKRNSKLVDYFLIHNFLRISLERFPEEDAKIVKFPNSTPHILLLDVFAPFDEKKWSAIKQMTSIHKLTYKRDKEDMEKKGTYYDIIINQGKI